MFGKKNIFLGITWVAGIIAVVFFLTSIGMMIPGLVFAGLYGTTESDYVYTKQGYCNVTSYEIANATCSYQCNCVKCGKTQCCGTCYYLCYDGSWHIMVSNNAEFSNTSGGWIELVQKRALKGDLFSVVAKLETKPIGSVYKCYYNPDNHRDISDDKSDDPEVFMILMVSFLSAMAAASLLFVISGGIGCASWCFYVYETEDKK